MSERKRILVVDDDQDIQQVTRELLEANGYEVLSALNGTQGLETARRARPDLILLDVMMATETEGFDVSREFQEIPELRGTPVIILTGIVSRMGLTYHFEPEETWLPVKAVLEKPVPPARLLAEIQKCLA
jgi:CheY-like chemotaxis protein